MSVLRWTDCVVVVVVRQAGNLLVVPEDKWEQGKKKTAAVFAFDEASIHKCDGIVRFLAAGLSGNCRPCPTVYVKIMSCIFFS